MTDPQADHRAELEHLERQIGQLTAEMERARAGYETAIANLNAAKLRHAAVWRQIQAKIQAEAQVAAMAGTLAAGPPVGWPSAGGSGPAAPTQAPVGRPETSTRTAQNVLFALGGLLLGTAAIVFTAVAWATFGNAGRAAILAVVTALALSAPPLALRRRLTATAETFAVLGIVLVLLDGYAAWFVNLFGVKAIETPRYVGLVFAVAAVAAGAYGAVTRLVGPGFLAVLLAQPVLPLIVAPAAPNTAGWAFVFIALAAANLGFARAGSGLLMRISGWVLYAITIVIALPFAALALVLADTLDTAVWAALATVAIATLLAGAAAIVPALRGLASASAVIALVLGGGRVAAIAWPAYQLLSVTAVIAAVAVAAAALTRLTPRVAGLGVRIGTLIVATPYAAYVIILSVAVAATTAANAVPLWNPGQPTTPKVTWQLLVAIGLIALALLATVPGVGPRAAVPGATIPGAGALILTTGTVLATLALPGAVALAPWAPSAVDLLVAGALGLLAVRGAVPRAVAMRGAGALVLAAHATVASLGRPEYTAAILGGLVVLGAILAVAARPADGARRNVAGIATLIGLLALPPAIGSAAVAADSRWAGEFTVMSLALLVGAQAAARRWWPTLGGYAFCAAIISAAIWPLVVAGVGDESTGVYAGIGLIALALTTIDPRSTPVDGSWEGNGNSALAAAAPVAFPSAVLLTVDVLPAVLSVVALPYSWLGSIWSGRPVGVGLAPADAVIDKPFVGMTQAVALGLLAVASAITTYGLRRRIRSAIGGLAIGGPTAILVAVTAAQAPWPAVPATTLALGLLILAAAAITGGATVRTAIAVGQGLLYVGAGLAAALTVEWATLAALGATAAAAVVVGWFGRGIVWRVWAWIAAVAAVLAFAIAAGLAADLTLRDTAFITLGAAALCLAGGATLRRRSSAEGTAVEASAHVGAAICVLMALVATPTSVAAGAAAATGWGVAVGLRTLWPGTTRAGRVALAAGAAAWELLAWWMLMAERDVAIVEAYTLPLSGVALLAGWGALRRRPELNSWTAYGSALCAAFLPSLATLLVVVNPYTEEVAPGWRRLLLGAGALVVVIGGSVRRRQAPVVAGGLVLAVLAVHEIAVFWDLAPRWIPPAVAGLLLVGLAMTYERRRRDVARLRQALGRMT